MKRPDMESLEAAPQAADSMLQQSAITRSKIMWNPYVWERFTLECAPSTVLELIRYVKVLEKAFDGRVRNSDPPQHVESQTAAYLDAAERELFPEAQS